MNKNKDGKVGGWIALGRCLGNRDLEFDFLGGDYGKTFSCFCRRTL